ncbi:hypothetical protein BRADI_4g07010v3, partial [Brachypodium distachyon]
HPLLPDQPFPPPSPAPPSWSSTPPKTLTPTLPSPPTTRRGRSTTPSSRATGSPTLPPPPPPPPPPSQMPVPAPAPTPPPSPGSNGGGVIEEFNFWRRKPEAAEAVAAIMALAAVIRSSRATTMMEPEIESSRRLPTSSRPARQLQC